MELIVNRTNKLKGIIQIPGSKSHTIRAVIIAGMAKGISYIRNPLESFDTKAALNAINALGAKVEIKKGLWIIEGTGSRIFNPNKVLDMMNSGTSMNLITGLVSLADFEISLDGDDSLKSRPMKPLLDSLTELGVRTISYNNSGKPPVKIKGPYRGGKTVINGLNSQFVSSLLFTAPLAKNDTEVIVENLHEIPYVHITLKWLDEQNIKYEKKDDLSWFKIYGNQTYVAFDKEIPSDWSSAAFPICAGLIIDSDILIKGPDINDIQGDKKIIDLLISMGANISIEKEGIRVKKSNLKGRLIDLNAMPDALPVLSIIGCYASGETIITNVAQARIKETDRIKVMFDELIKMGAKIKELPDGLHINKSDLIGNKLNGYYDHRIIMALSLAGMISEGQTIIDTAESIGVTFPDYINQMKKIGCSFKIL